jgi:hypothetical protein
MRGGMEDSVMNEWIIYGMGAALGLGLSLFTPNGSVPDMMYWLIGCLTGVGFAMRLDAKAGR